MEEGRDGEEPVDDPEGSGAVRAVAAEEPTAKPTNWKQQLPETSGAVTCVACSAVLRLPAGPMRGIGLWQSVRVPSSGDGTVGKGPPRLSDSLHVSACLRGLTDLLPAFRVALIHSASSTTKSTLDAQLGICGAHIRRHVSIDPGVSNSACRAVYFDCTERPKSNSPDSHLGWLVLRSRRAAGSLQNSGCRPWHLVPPRRRPSFPGPRRLSTPRQPRRRRSSRTSESI